MYKAFQIRAARGIAGWSQTELAERAGLSLSAIRDAETDENKNTLAKTYEKIRRTFEAEAIYFTERGAEKRDSCVYPIDGEGWWLRVLDDVYYTLLDKKNGECLFLFADDRASTPEGNNRIRKLRNAGIRMRQLVQEGNRYLMGPVGEYRWVPREYFMNYVTLIYGDKVAVCADNNIRALIFADPQLATVWRNLFEMLWKGIPVLEPDRSTADERY